jgi:hypothetical protein
MTIEKIISCGRSIRKAMAATALFTLLGCAARMPIPEFYQRAAPAPIAYQSPVIKAEYSFMETEKCSETIDESRYPIVKGDTAWVVGYSHVYSAERSAMDDARLSGMKAILELTGKQECKIYPEFGPYEIHKVEKGGQSGYAAHVVCKAREEK